MGYRFSRGDGRSPKPAGVGARLAVVQRPFRDQPHQDIGIDERRIGAGRADVAVAFDGDGPGSVPEEKLAGHGCEGRLDPRIRHPRAGADDFRIVVAEASGIADGCRHELFLFQSSASNACRRARTISRMRP